eukprot:scaffold79944_cov60-Phaeocystis_antarctica.AAC.1
MGCRQPTAGAVVMQRARSGDAGGLRRDIAAAAPGPPSFMRPRPRRRKRRKRPDGEFPGGRDHHAGRARRCNSLSELHSQIEHVVALTRGMLRQQGTQRDSSGGRTESGLAYLLPTKRHHCPALPSPKFSQ